MKFNYHFLAFGVLFFLSVDFFWDNPKFLLKFVYFSTYLLHRVYLYFMYICLHFLYILMRCTHCLLLFLSFLLSFLPIYPFYILHTFITFVQPLNMLYIYVRVRMCVRSLHSILIIYPITPWYSDTYIK